MENLGSMGGELLAPSMDTGSHGRFVDLGQPASRLCRLLLQKIVYRKSIPALFDVAFVGTREWGLGRR